MAARRTAGPARSPRGRRRRDPLALSGFTTGVNVAAVLVGLVFVGLWVYYRLPPDGPIPSGAAMVLDATVVPAIVYVFAVLPYAGFSLLFSIGDLVRARGACPRPRLRSFSICWAGVLIVVPLVVQLFGVS